MHMFLEEFYLSKSKKVSFILTLLSNLDKNECGERLTLFQQTGMSLKIPIKKNYQGVVLHISEVYDQNFVMFVLFYAGSVIYN